MRDKRGYETDEDSLALSGAPSGVQAKADGGITTLDAVLENLTDSKRRSLLYHLREQESSTIEESARQLVAWEENIPLDAVTEDDCDRVVSELIHNHLPKLAEAFFIEYDPLSGAIRYNEPPALLDSILRLLEQLERGFRE